MRTGVKVNGQPRASDRFHSSDPAFTEILGTPEKLTVSFPLPDPDDSLKTSLELWGKNAVLRCWCADTKTAHRLTKDGEVIQTPCTYPECQQYKQRNCTPVGRLKFAIPELGPGLFQLDTKSWNSISALMGTLAMFKPIPASQLFELYMVKRKNKQGVFNVLQLKPIVQMPEDAPEAPEEE